MPRILLHAGFAKTGTTSLQALFKSNAGRMPPGVVYIPQDSPDVRPLRRAARVWAPGDPEAPVLRAARRLRAAIGRARADTVIVSTEALGGGMPSADPGRGMLDTAGPLATLLAQVFPGADLVYTIREREAWLRSVHATHSVSQRHLPPWEDWVRQETRSGFGWEPVLEEVRAAGLTVHVLRMEDDLAHPLGPGAGLARLAGLEETAAAWEPAGPLNRSPSDLRLRLVQSRLVRALPRPLHRLARRALTSR